MSHHMHMAGHSWRGMILGLRGARLFQVELHLQRIAAHRLDGCYLGRLHPQLGVSGDPQLSGVFLVLATDPGEGSKVGRDLPAAI